MKDQGIIEIMAGIWHRLVVAVILVTVFVLVIAVCRAFNVKLPGPEEFRNLEAYQAAAQVTFEKWQESKKLVRDTSESVNQYQRQIKELGEKSNYLYNWITRWGSDWRAWKANEEAKKKAENDLVAAQEKLRIVAAQERAAQKNHQEAEKRLMDAPWTTRVGAYCVKLLKAWAWGIGAFVLLYVTPVGRWLRRTLVWFGPGMFIEKFGRALVFPKPEKPEAQMQTTGDRVALDVVVREDEEAWFRPGYLDRTNKPKSLKVGLRWAFSWKYPLLTALSGLWGLSHFKGSKSGVTTIKLSDPEDATIEFRTVTIPESQSLILRPHHIVGVIFPVGKNPYIKRHWRILKLQAWIIGQVIYFEFHGPVTIILKGSRGLQWHRATADTNYELRMIPGSLIAFNPALTLFALRSLNFWQYIFGIGPVFDYSLKGDAVFISQQATERSQGSGMLRFGAAIGDGIMRLIGL